MRIHRLSLLLFITILSAPVSVAAAPRSGFVDRVVFQAYASGLLRASYGDWNGAAREFERAYRLQPNSTQLLGKLAESYLHVGRVAEAEKMAMRAIDQDPRNSEAYLLLASIAYNRGDLATADQHFLKRLEIVPTDFETRFRLGLIRQQLQDWKGSIEIFRDYPLMRGGGAAARHQLGVALTQIGDYRDARKAFQEVLNVNPGAMEAAENIAILSEELGEETAALRAWERVLDIDPGHTDALRHRTSLLVVLGEFELAQRALEHLIGIKPEFERDQSLRRLLLQIALQNQDTATVTRTLLRLADETATETAYLQAAFAASQIAADTAVVVEALEKAFHAGRRAGIGVLLARSYFQAGDTDRAVELLDRIVSENPNDTEALWARALIHHKRGFQERAMQSILRIIEINPFDAEALNWAAYTWAERAENLEQAENFVMKAIAIDSDNPQYIDSLGWIYFQTGRYEAAARELERAHTLMPGEPTIIEHLGDAWLKLGDQDRALELYRESLATGAAENPEALKAKIQSLEQKL